MARITVEDSLKNAGNRFALVLLASQRARHLLKGDSPRTDVRNNREIVSALREIADGKVGFAHPEHLEKIKEEYKQIDDHTEFIGDEEYTE